MSSFIYGVVGMRFDYTHYSKNVKLNIIDLSVNKFLANKNKYLNSQNPYFRTTLIDIIPIKIPILGKAMKSKSKKSFARQTFGAKLKINRYNV